MPTQFHSNVCLQAWQLLKLLVYGRDVIIKRLMLVLKVVLNCHLPESFHMANSWQSMGIMTYSLISIPFFLFLFFFGGGQSAACQRGHSFHIAEPYVSQTIISHTYIIFSLLIKLYYYYVFITLFLFYLLKKVSKTGSHAASIVTVAVSAQLLLGSFNLSGLLTAMQSGIESLFRCCCVCVCVCFYLFLFLRVKTDLQQ